MNADHRRQRRERLPVGRERIGEAAVGEERVRDQQLLPVAAAGLVLEGRQRILRHGVVGVEQRVPRRRERGREVRDLAELGRGLERPAGLRIGAGKQAPVFEVGRFRRADPPQWSNGFVRCAQREIAGAEEQLRRDQRRLQRRGALERRDRLGLASGHRQRHPEIHQQSRFVGERLQQLAIDPDRLLEPAVVHRLRRGPAASGGIAGLWPAMARGRR